jgi:hypothetical protein
MSSSLSPAASPAALALADSFFSDEMNEDSQKRQRSSSPPAVSSRKVIAETLLPDSNNTNACTAYPSPHATVAPSPFPVSAVSGVIVPETQQPTQHGHSDSGSSDGGDDVVAGHADVPQPAALLPPDWSAGVTAYDFLFFSHPFHRAKRRWQLHDQV